MVFTLHQKAEFYQMWAKFFFSVNKNYILKITKIKFNFKTLFLTHKK